MRARAGTLDADDGPGMTVHEGNEPAMEADGGGTAPARRSLLLFLPLVAFAAFMGVVILPLLRGTDPSRVPSALIGKPVPAFALPAVAGLDRPGLDSADLRTGEVTILNVFASWCVPCREEAPALTALSASGRRMVGIAYKDRAESTKAFLGEGGDPFKAVGSDAQGRTGIDFGVYGVPETYVIKGDGTIAAKIVGPLTDDNIRDELMPALARAHGAVPAKG